jgi:hypothetical protein
MLYLPPLWFHHVINNDAGFSVNVWTDYTLQELYQGLFKKLLTINKEFNVGVKLHTLQYLVSELLERTGKHPHIKTYNIILLEFLPTFKFQWTAIKVAGCLRKKFAVPIKSRSGTWIDNFVR